jgi:hypothetical protein
MKILSATRTYLLLSALAILALLSLRVFAQPYPTPTEPPVDKGSLILKIKKDTALKVSETEFKEILKAHERTMSYDIVIHKENNQWEHPVHGSSAKLEIKTDRVITSDLAKSGGGFTLIQTRVTQQVSSSSTSDIKAVLDTLQ